MELPVPKILKRPGPSKPSRQGDEDVMMEEGENIMHKKVKGKMPEMKSTPPMRIKKMVSPPLV